MGHFHSHSPCRSVLVDQSRDHDLYPAPATHIFLQARLQDHCGPMVRTHHGTQTINIYINKYIIILNTCQCIAAFVRQTLNPSPHFCPPYPPYASASHKDTKVSAPSSMPSLCRARHNLEARDASARPQTRNNGRCRPKSWPPLPITYCITALL